MEVELNTEEANKTNVELNAEEANKTKVELNTELENNYYKIQVKGLELDGRYLFIRGIVLDIEKKDAFEFEDSIDISDFCWNDSCEPVNDNDEQIKET